MPNWKLRDLILVLSISGIAVILVQFGLSSLNFSIINLDPRYRSLIILSLFLLQSLILILPLYLLVFHKYHNSWQEIGFRSIKISKILKNVFLAYGLYFLISIVLISLENFSHQSVPGLERQSPLLPLFGQNQPGLIIAFFIIVILGPLVEEIFFRGFILQTLGQKFGYFWGNITTALLFAIIHFEFKSLLGILILAFLLNWLFLRSKSLWTCLVFHSINNLLAFSAELYISNHPEILTF